MKKILLLGVLALGVMTVQASNDGGAKFRKRVGGKMIVSLAILAGVVIFGAIAKSNKPEDEQDEE